MAGRTFAIGDTHGELDEVYALFSMFPKLTAEDTVVFVGDYLDRGPKPAQLVEYLRRFLPNETEAKVVTLRGNHEDAWLHVIDEGWAEFVLPPKNGCLSTLRSFIGGPAPILGDVPDTEEYKALFRGEFFPKDVVEWMRSLPFYYEDEHAIYVHAGIPNVNGRWPHPSEFVDPTPLLWIRTREFFSNYTGKRVVFGHTTTEFLPQDCSRYTPDDPTDLYAGESVVGLDTGCGQGGFLSAIELPGMIVYETRRLII